MPSASSPGMSTPVAVHFELFELIKNRKIGLGRLDSFAELLDFVCMDVTKKGAGGFDVLDSFRV